MDTRLLLASARRRAQTLRMKLAGAQRAVQNSRHELALNIAEKKVDAYTRQLAEAEADIQRLTSDLETSKPLPMQVIESDFVDWPPHEDDDLTIPPFLRRE